MITEKIENWYEPSEVKISRLPQEEIDKYRKKKLARLEKEKKDKLARQDLTSYVIGKIFETQKRIKK